MQVPKGEKLNLEQWEERTAVLEAAAPTVPRVYMLRHALAVQQQDCFSAVESLHRYFDYWEGTITAKGDYVYIQIRAV